MFPLFGRFFFLLSCFLCEMLMRGQCQVHLRNTTKNNFRNMVDKNLIRENLRRFTERPHPVASIGEDLITNYIRDTWQSYGFEVEEPEYEIVLQFPQENNPNKVSIINNDTREVEYEIIAQLNVTAGRGHNGTIYKYTPYMSFVTAGTVEGELVFAGSGWAYDLQQLRNKNISLKGKIVIIQDVLSNFPRLEKEGAIGVIAYTGPMFHAFEGTGVNNTFPNKPWLPGDGIFTSRGVYFFGDQTTPLLPTTNGMRLQNLNETGRTLSIPLQTISYDDARYLLTRMQGEIAPASMRGILDIDYRLGPGLNRTNNNSAPVVRLEVNNRYINKTIRNVIATIPGTEEPDRYVLIGNHKDAEFFGGVDASSGTAVLMEISRVLWNLTQNGWRPRRTIKLCSWSGEEDGLMGSTEWVQENLKLLKKRAVAYLNTDPSIMGTDLLNVQASPLLGDVILNNARELQHPANNSITLFDSMVNSLPRSKDYPGEPHIYINNQHASDHVSFLHLLGLSVADFAYFRTYYDQKILYPVYHTQYDTFEYFERFCDPNFLFSKLMTKLLGSILIDLSDSEVLPFNVTRFAKSVQNAFETLKIWRGNAIRLDQLQITYLELAVKSFVNMTKTFESAKSRLTNQQTNPLVLRMLNDQMSGLEKTFFTPNAMRGLLGDMNAKIAKELSQSYQSDNMLLIKEQFNNFVKIVYMENLTQKEKDEYFKFEMSLIIQAVREATKLLEPLR